jgi:hypothetical protein
LVKIRCGRTTLFLTREPKRKIKSILVTQIKNKEKKKNQKKAEKPVLSHKKQRLCARER